MERSKALLAGALYAWAVCAEDSNIKITLHNLIRSQGIY